ncbi:MAG: NFACT family protein [Firmicutes bacterium]|jgi:predicted ribosome quality control (RQC) complex YloA/Tae2 family protein|nr:NFACT family protein [Bacillota bacterium]MDH7495044.1 NFACT RNA binding domain-containing protein [Bacillota bacterium]
MMTFDGIVMAAVAAELAGSLEGARVDAVYQPGKLDVLLIARRLGKSVRVVMSAEASCARVHLTRAERENPAFPPAFCMLLRKHLVGARIARVEQRNLDRILEIGFMGPYDDPPKTLVVETMGRHSNIILVDDGSGLVLDSVKHVTPAVSRVRQVRPGVPYVPPPSQGKLDPLLVSAEEFMEELARFTRACPDLGCDEFLTRVFTGIGRDSAAVIASHAAAREGEGRGGATRGLDGSPLECVDLDSAKRLWEEFSRAMTRVRERDFSPCAGFARETREVAWISVIGPPAAAPPDAQGQVAELRQMREGRDADGSAYRLRPGSSQEDQEEAIVFPMVGALLDYAFAPREKAVTLAGASAEVSHAVATALERLRRKLAAQEAEIAQAEQADELRRAGELIAANAQLIERGRSTAQVVDYFDPELRKVEVVLDPRLSPQENAQEYFKKYSRAKRRLAAAREHLEHTRAELAYLEQVSTTIEQAESVEALEGIRRELAEQGYLASPRRERPITPKGRVASGPLSFSVDGHEVLVGRNNAENDALTLRLAHPEDIWLHARGVPGAHVVIRVGPLGPRGISDAVLLRAAEIAAYYSKARAASKAAVDYTLRRHVRKPRGARPGMVVYDHEKTIMAAPRPPA